MKQQNEVLRVGTVNIENELYTIYSNDHVDQVFYHVVRVPDGEEVCVLALNDEGAWEAAYEVDEQFLQTVGREIERLSG